MPLTASEIDAIRSKMEEDHRAALARLAEEQRLDMMALDRLSRFLPVEKDQKAGQAQNDAKFMRRTVLHSAVRIPSLVDGESLIDATRKVFSANSNSQLISKDVYFALKSAKYPFSGSERQAMATISTALGKLEERGFIRILHKGAGRDPNVYQFKEAALGITSLNGGESEIKMEAGELISSGLGQELASPEH